MVMLWMDLQKPVNRDSWLEDTFRSDWSTNYLRIAIDDDGFFVSVLRDDKQTKSQ
jgi:hypothetical protein